MPYKGQLLHKIKLFVLNILIKIYIYIFFYLSYFLFSEYPGNHLLRCEKKCPEETKESDKNGKKKSVQIWRRRLCANKYLKIFYKRVSISLVGSVKQGGNLYHEESHT